MSAAILHKEKRTKDKATCLKPFTKPNKATKKVRSFQEFFCATMEKSRRTSQKIAVGTTDTTSICGAKEGSIFFRLKSKIFFAFRYAHPRKEEKGG